MQVFFDNIGDEKDEAATAPSPGTIIRTAQSKKAGSVCSTSENLAMALMRVEHVEQPTLLVAEDCGLRVNPIRPLWWPSPMTY